MYYRQQVVALNTEWSSKIASHKPGSIKKREEARYDDAIFFNTHS